MFLRYAATHDASTLVTALLAHVLWQTVQYKLWRVCWDTIARSILSGFVLEQHKVNFVRMVRWTQSGCAVISRCVGTHWALMARQHGRCEVLARNRDFHVVSQASLQLVLTPRLSTWP